MHYRYYVIFIINLLISVYLTVRAQEFEKYESLEDLAEAIYSETDQQTDYSTLFDELHYYYENPLNINAAGYDDLKKLYILSDFQIQCLLDYIAENGPMVSIFEINYIYGFTQKEAKFLAPLVTLEPVKATGQLTLKEAYKHGQHEIILRAQRVLEKQKGYIPVSDSILQINPNTGRYLGDPYKLYLRYKYILKDRIYIGLTAEKDAGEEFFNGYNKNNFDFSSAHLQINNTGFFKKIHIGDYHLQFGQGLTLWSGLAFGKSAYVMNIERRAEGIRTYVSSDENIFFRGAATTLSAGRFDITLFYSLKKRDANITDTLRSGFYEFSAFQNTGYHRTPLENYDEKAIKESAYGTNITYKRDYWSLGTTFVHYDFGGELKEAERIYNKFDFSGSQVTNIGIDYRAYIRKVSLFGEATSGNNAFGIINGAVAYVNSLVSFSAYYRLYRKELFAHYGNALSENADNANENGFYLGTEIHPYRNLKISAYSDIYKFPWLKYNVSAPSLGTDFFIGLDYTGSNNFESYLRIYHEREYENSTGEDTLVAKPYEVNRFKIRIHMSCSINRNLQLRNRLELTRIKRIGESPDNGYLLYQDFIYKNGKLPLSLYLRYALFDTDSYYSRIYAYENDLLYAYSIPALYFRGVRTYIMIKYSVTSHADLWVKYSRTTYAGKDIIGSGLDEIEGNTKSEIKFQLRVKF
jgi:hypothetical protein